jgi:hypothetical protein
MENDAKQNIERVTEAIFNVLYHEGDMDLQELRKKVGAPSHIFDMAIGSLVEKDDVELLQNSESFIAHRTDPAPAVFPLRSN